MTDVKAFRAGVSRLLAEVQRIKAEGDYEAARALVESYGVHFSTGRSATKSSTRVDHLDLPSYTGFVMPRLEAVTAADGSIADVTMSYPCDLTSQMLEYSSSDTGAARLSHRPSAVSLAMFSSRLPADLAPTPLARAMETARQSGDVIDLTESNPTRAGFAYPDLHDVFDRVDLVAYDPDPRGLAAAREAIAADYARRRVAVAADRILLTASSSESYAHLFKVLCDPGDGVLVPVPSYPLFDHLAGLEGIRLVPYRLEYHDRWHLDVDDLARRLDRSDPCGARGVPEQSDRIGAAARRSDRLTRLCAERQLALIGDEVFADYPVDAASPAAVSVIEQHTALAISLGGLSKSAGSAAPQARVDGGRRSRRRGRGRAAIASSSSPIPTCRSQVRCSGRRRDCCSSHRASESRSRRA